MSETNHIPGGAILLARVLQGSELWGKDALFLKLWVLILLNAAYEPCEQMLHGFKYKVERGQLVTTYKVLSAALGWKKNNRLQFLSEKQLRIMLAWFKDQQMIAFGPLLKTERALSNKGTGAVQARAQVGIRISVENYDIYQSLSTYKGTGLDTPSDEQGHTSIYKKLKKEKKKESKKKEDFSSSHSSQKHRTRRVCDAEFT